MNFGPRWNNQLLFPFAVDPPEVFGDKRQKRRISVAGFNGVDHLTGYKTAVRSITFRNKGFLFGIVSITVNNRNEGLTGIGRI